MPLHNYPIYFSSCLDSNGVFFIPAFSGLQVIFFTDCLDVLPSILSQHVLRYNLQAPINDDKACCGLIGLSRATSKAHIMRAVLESFAFRFRLLYRTILRETKTPLTDTIQYELSTHTSPVSSRLAAAGVSCRCDGGVCNNDFLVQLMSDLVSVPIKRPAYTESTSLGAAFLAGLSAGSRVS